MIPLFKPHMPELPGLNKVLHSGMLSAGDYTKEFENKLKEYFGCPYVLVTNSFSNAIYIALSVLRVKADDEVLMSPMACLASTQPFLAHGCSVKWGDIDPHRGTLCPDSVKRRISSKTKVIVHNHFCGYPGYIDEINKIGKENDIAVIDDGIECFGSEYKGQKVGRYGEAIAVFSLSAVRIPNCIEGGIVIFKHQDQYEKAILIRDSGINRNLFRNDIGEINPLCDIKDIGYSATMSNINGYIGVQQMMYVDELLQKQRQQAHWWNDKLNGNKEYVMLSHDYSTPNYWVYGILADNKREVILKFRKKGYYASGVHSDNSKYSIFGHREYELPGVDDFCKRFIGLPCGWWM